MKAISGMGYAMHQEPQRTAILCSFDDVCEPTCIPVRFNQQVNRSLAVSRRRKGNWQYIMMLNLMKVSDVPAIGQHKGIYADIKTASGKNAEGNEFKDLIVSTELETTDSTGKPYRLDKKYNLLNRGLATFRGDYKSWSGKKLSDKDLAAFDADKLMKGKSVIVVVKHGKDGKDLVARIDTFLPVPAAMQVNG
jgi:hypothetical protein